MNNEKQTPNRQNRLGNESSPYLQQHKDNPVAWLPWGEEAFELARQEDKPIFLSIGYSTCHWCHVMAHESFEDQEVADVLNQNFICIKVDREELPDVDDVYMTALQAMTGGGGWPLSAWLTADGRPFFAGTYFQKFRLLQLLRRITQVWLTERASLSSDGERLIAALREEAQYGQEESSEVDYEDFLKGYINHFQYHFDEINGGFGKAPKFPPTMNLMMMMRQDAHTGLRQAEAIVGTTLLKMVRGGVFDQLNGGFHRYSVDDKWLVPHFEKMLYDQALIGVAMAEAYASYGEPELARAVRETMDYVLREMYDGAGGFYSAQDADSLNPVEKVNQEGYFCTYSQNDLTAILSETELAALVRCYGVTEQGHLEGRNILHLQEGVDGSVLSDPDIASAFSKLKQLRAARPQPHIDNKVIASWNGWMVWSLTKASQVLSEPRYLKAAEEALEFMHANLFRDGKLMRYWRKGKSVGAGTAEDYCSVIHACFEFSQSNANPKWSNWALELQQQLDQTFWDVEEGLYFSNNGESSLLPLRSKDDYDGVTPSSNSMAALNLWRFYLLTGADTYRAKAEAIFQALFPRLKRQPSGQSFLAIALDYRVSDTKVVVTDGKGWTGELRSELGKRFYPHLLWVDPREPWSVAKSIAKKNDEISQSLYICIEGQCLPPCHSRDEALTILGA